MTTPDKFFKPSLSLHEENVLKFRDLYRKLSKVTSFNEHEIDKKSLRNAAQELGIQIRLDIHEEILAISVTYDDEADAFHNISIHLRISAQQLLSDHHPRPTSAVELTTKDKSPIILNEVKCVVIIKRRNKDVDEFVRTFLLQPVKKTSTNKCEISSFEMI